MTNTLINVSGRWLYPDPDPHCATFLNADPDGLMPTHMRPANAVAGDPCPGSRQPVADRYGDPLPERAS